MDNILNILLYIYLVLSIALILVVLRLVYVGYAKVKNIKGFLKDSIFSKTTKNIEHITIKYIKKK